MAAPSGQIKPSRYFLALAAIIAVLYALVFFTGDHKPKPKLGLDLQGGTSMTLAATVGGGKAPDRAKLDEAKDIIANRVNPTGVGETDVVTAGDRNIIVNVPGKRDREELQKLVAPAELRFRKVIKTVAAPGPDALPSASPSSSASPAASGSPAPSASASGAQAAPASAAPSASAKASASAAPASAAPSASASAAANPSAAPSASATPDANQQQRLQAVIDKVGEQAWAAAQAIQDPSEVTQQNAAPLEPFKQLTPDEVAVLPAQIQYNVPQIGCDKLNSRAPDATSNKDQRVVACGKEQGAPAKYLLDVAKVLGTDVKTAAGVYDSQSGQWKVTMAFTGSGQDRWTNLTKEAYGDGTNKQAVAIVLDTRVVSAPTIQGVITGDAEITGNFSKEDVQTLAAQLKYGSLPVSFQVQSVSSVTPTLGLASLEAGLIAGAIGLALVIVYCMIYYRALGLVVIASLVVSAAIVYGSLVVLGRQMGFALSLAGVAGFIVAIGITADSFVVFFERLKDEVRDGRGVRSAVPRAWVRARRTILSADTVSLLAAAVLYFLAVGAVQGFAFTLGLSTIIDLIVVFLFTHPLVALLSRSSTFSSPRVSGLGRFRAGAPTTATPTTRRAGVVRTKES